MPKIKIEMEIADAILLREAILIMASQSRGETRTGCVKILDDFNQKIKDALEVKL